MGGHLDASQPEVRDPEEALLAQLGADDTARGAGYERLRGRLVAFFGWKGSLAPYELADETLRRVAGKLAGGESLNGPVERYAIGVARFVYLESVKQDVRTKTAVDELSRRPDRDPEHERRLEALERCMEGLTGDDADLVTRYHQVGRGKDKITTRADLARERGWTPNALRIRVMRIRQALYDCVAGKLAD